MTSNIVRDAVETARQTAREAKIAQSLAEREARRVELLKANETWMLETKAHRERVESLLETLIEEIRENRRLSLSRRSR